MPSTPALRRARCAVAAVLVVALSVSLAACGAKNTPEDVEADIGRRPVPYSRRTVTTSVPPVSSAQDYRDRLLAGTGADGPEPPEAFGVTSTRPPGEGGGKAASSTTTTASGGGAGGGAGEASTSSSSTATTSAAVDAAACKQYGQLLAFVTEMLQLVDPADPTATAMKLGPPVAANRAGLEQLLSSPAPEMAAQTVAIINWLSNKARGAVTDDAAFESAVNSVRGWHNSKC